VLGVFPAGEVAAFTPRTRQIADPAWRTTVAGLISRGKEPVVPIYFDCKKIECSSSRRIDPSADCATVWLAHEYMKSVAHV